MNARVCPLSGSSFNKLILKLHNDGRSVRTNVTRVQWFVPSCCNFLHFASGMKRNLRGTERRVKGRKTGEKKRTKNAARSTSARQKKETETRDKENRRRRKDCRRTQKSATDDAGEFWSRSFFFFTDDVSMIRRAYLPLSPMISSLNRWSYSRAILTYMTRTVPLVAASQPPDRVRDTTDTLHDVAEYFCRACVRTIRACIHVHQKRCTIPTRSSTAVGIAILLYRPMTLVSNDRHVYALWYHHSLSLRREKKKATLYVQRDAHPISSCHQFVTAAIFLSTILRARFQRYWPTRVIVKSTLRHWSHVNPDQSATYCYVSRYMWLDGSLVHLAFKVKEQVKWTDPDELKT